MVLNGKSESDQPNHACFHGLTTCDMDAKMSYLSPHQPVIVSSRSLTPDRPRSFLFHFLPTPTLGIWQLRQWVCGGAKPPNTFWCTLS